MKIQLPNKCAFCGYKDRCLIQFQLPESWAGTQIKQLRPMRGRYALHGAYSVRNNEMLQASTL
jgi:hypothetical protein